MAIPAALIEACERNKFMWRREDPRQIDTAFGQLNLEKRGQLYEFAKRYCLQFASDSLSFQLVDFVEDDGPSDNIFYAREELGIDVRLIPISTYEAESIYAVGIDDDRVVYLTPSPSGEDWNVEVVGESFYDFMLRHLA